MCGNAGANAPVCVRPDPSQPDTGHWKTLLTIGVDTEGCVLEYAAGNPQVLHGAAAEGQKRSSTHSSLRAQSALARSGSTAYGLTPAFTVLAPSLATCATSQSWQ